MLDILKIKGFAAFTIRETYFNTLGYKEELEKLEKEGKL